MKQYGIALHNYANIYEQFPSAIGHYKNAMLGMNIAVTPFLELQAIYGAYQREPEYLPQPWGAASLVEWSGPIFSFLCPSDPNSHINNIDTSYTAWASRPGRTNICTCRGDFSLSSQNNGAALSQMKPSNGWVLASDPLIVRGSFGVLPVLLAAYTDGLSNTVGISELVVAETIGTRNVKGGVSDDFGTPAALASWALPSECLGKRDPNDSAQLIGTVAAGAPRGSNWADGRVLYTGFMTALPPNAPSCGVAADGGYHTAQSYHTGGVNAGLLDASVRFISETIDIGDRNYQLLLNNAANISKFQGIPSPYGVWGAYGTRAGAEVVSLP
jgi:hypothetical protein